MDVMFIAYRLLTLACLALIFVPIELVFKAVKEKPMWRKDIPADVIHFVINYGLSNPATWLIIAATMAVICFVCRQPYHEIEQGGFGPVIHQPFWLILIEMVLIGDFSQYWRHRMMHHRLAWDIHAVHHSSTDLDWLSAARFHPLEQICQWIFNLLFLFCLGFPLTAIGVYIPFVSLVNIFQHSNLDWTFGPFRYVIAGPAFHRWHHTKQKEGHGKNFAPVFPFIDLIFGTYYLPLDRPPRDFGVIGSKVPTSYFGQLAHPFKMTAKKLKKRLAASKAAANQAVNSAKMGT